jgi:hypothetical protein
MYNSGVSTYLKTIAGRTHGFNIDPKSTFNYQGNIEFAFLLVVLTSH